MRKVKLHPNNVLVPGVLKYNLDDIAQFSKYIDEGKPILSCVVMYKENLENTTFPEEWYDGRIDNAYCNIINAEADYLLLVGKRRAISYALRKKPIYCEEKNYQIVNKKDIEKAINKGADPLDVLVKRFFSEVMKEKSFFSVEGLTKILQDINKIPKYLTLNS